MFLMIENGDFFMSRYYNRSRNPFFGIRSVATFLTRPNSNRLAKKIFSNSFQLIGFILGILRRQ